jgi:hypothetical protein
MLENSINRSESLEYKTNPDFCHLFSQLTIIIVLQMEQDCLKKLTERSRLKRQVASKTVTRGDYAVAAVRYFHAFLK